MEGSKFQPNRRDLPRDPGPGSLRTPVEGESSSSDVPIPAEGANAVELPLKPHDPEATIVDYPRKPPDPEATWVDPDATLVDLGKPVSSTGHRHSGLFVSAAVLESGDVLGQRYEILQLLGEGGMGAVYKAKDRELDRFVALKVIRPELASSPAILARFKQELLLAHQVTHKNVIRIYDFAEADGIKFITMEFIEGTDLRSLLLSEGKCTAEYAVDVMRQVCLALEAAHSVGVIHRDLKPQNIMRDKQGRILVMDFGLARTVEGSGMTQTGALVGTMEYMSPEQAMGKDLDQRSDLFALGLIFYELLTGKAPYKADSALASLLKRTQERATPICDLDRNIPMSLSNLVSKCLERDPKLRYATAKELLVDLEHWQGKTAAASLRFPDIRPWAQGPWRWIALAVTVVILASAAILLRDKLFPHTTSQTVVKPDVSLAILPFRNASGDAAFDWLGPYLADMLNTEVGQSARLRTISPERVHQVLADLRMAPNASIDQTTLRRVAEYSSADTLVWGQFAKFGEQVRIDATLQDLKHDRSVPLKIEAASEKDIPGVVDRLAESIRQNLAVPRDVLKELKASSFQPSSKSVAALRQYNQGVQLLRDGKNLEAVKSLQGAIKEDPQFALAYSRLAETDSALGYDNDAEQASRKAVELAQQLPLAEKYLIEATHARIVKDNNKAVQAYENLSKTLPDNADVQYALGSLYRDQGDYDKARAVFSKILQADPKNTRALWQMGAVEIMSGNPQTALDPLTKGLSLAVQVDNQEQKALVLLAMGVAYKLLNKPEEALRSYQDSLATNEKIGQKRGMAADLNAMAQAQVVMGKPDSAVASFNRALQIRREIGANKEAGDTLIDLGNLYLDRGQHDQALKMYKDSLQIQRDAGDELNQALCLNNIGNVYVSRGDNEDALAYLQQALQLRQKLNVQPAIADTLQNLGNAYVNLGKDEEAMTHFMQALDLYRKSGDLHGAASQSYSMAFIFERQGRYGAAVNAMQEALKPLRDEGDRSLQMVQFLNHFGKLLAQAGRGAEAGKPLDQAQALTRELKNDFWQADILNTKGDILFYAGDLKGAKAVYEQAAHASSRARQPGEVLLSKINLAKIRLAEGDSATGEFGRLAQQAEALGERQLSVECSIYTAQTMLGKKDYSGARQQLEQILGKSEKLGLRLQTAEIHYLLGTLLRLSGNSAEAAGHYREALRLFDEMKKDPGADHLLDRADLHPIYAEAARLAGSAKS